MCCARSARTPHKRRYRDWDELMDYCRYSAAPVGTAIARSARREPHDLAGLGRALRRVAGAEPFAGLRAGLSPPRPRLPAARRPRSRRDRGRGARRAGREPGLAAGSSTSCLTAPLSRRDRARTYRPASTASGPALRMRGDRRAGGAPARSPAPRRPAGGSGRALRKVRFPRRLCERHHRAESDGERCRL